jgi:SAM-dependent methyltransferase
MESAYFDGRFIDAQVVAKRHRELVGGLWDEVGELQFEFLLKQGLKPCHKLLDLGCGCLRGGVHFIRYLEAGHYFGVDMNQSLLDAGYDIELAEYGLQERLPRQNLVCCDDFDVVRMGETFDFVLAQSLFTHLSFNRIRQCLERLAPVVRPGGVFFATFFELPEGLPTTVGFQHEPGGVVTHDTQDPYHYRFDDLRHAALGSPWRIEYLGDWSHPRGQRLAAFFRTNDHAATNDVPPRSRPSEANSLPPGAHHYRAYVGPPDRFDFMSATQFSLLFSNGLREHHHVLDFGCGSLRLGRLLIPFLLEGRYYGVEPNRWLIEEAIQNELGRHAIEIKKPAFSYRDDFDCSTFGMKFDFIMAQSILTHCGPDLFQRLLESFRGVLADKGLILVSMICTSTDDQGLPAPGWHYPGCVDYSRPQIESFFKNVGLHMAPIPWYHPGANWFLAARSIERLPTDADRRQLTGVVLSDPQFAASRTHRPLEPSTD